MGILPFSGENYLEMLLNDLNSRRNIPWNEEDINLSFAGKVIHGTFLGENFGEF